MTVLFFLLNLVRIVHSKNSYVVQTEDEKIHFIKEHIETFQLPFDRELGDRKKDSLMLYNSKAPPILQIPETSGNSLSRINRLDSISINQNGYVEFYDHQISIKDLLHTPIVEEGIYISATQENIPTVLNNTIVILSNIRIFLLDLYDYNSKILKFKQILYLSQIYENIPIKEKKIFLNNRWWEFNSRIIAVFVIKEKDGLNFMFRVANKSDLVNYTHPQPLQKKSRKTIFTVIIGIVLIFMYFKRHLKYSTTIIKGKLFLGKFVKKDCLIYRVCTSLLREQKKIYEKIKHPFLIHIYYESEGILHPVIVTEKTYQFKPEYPNNHEQSNTTVSESNETENNQFPRFELNSNLKILQFKDTIHKIISYFEHLHSIGIVHCRICPENIRINTQDNIRIQSIFDNSGWKSHLQLKNIRKKNYTPDILDDIFSLGCLIHYYLTGYHPFDLTDFVKKERKTAKKNTDTVVKTPEFQPIDTPKPVVLSNDNRFFFQNDFDIQNKESSINLQNVKSNDELENKKSENHRSFDRMYLKLYSQILKKFANFHNFSFLRYFRSLLFPKINFFSFLSKKGNKNESANIYKKIIPEDKINYIENNILFNTYRIRLTDQIEHDLIYHSIKNNSDDKKLKLSSHPYFWNNSKCLEFICDVSDFLESNSNFKPRLERTKKLIFQANWSDYLDLSLISAMTTKRTYDFTSLCDLIRFIRNTHRHFQEINSNSMFKALNGCLFDYFSSNFPELLMFLYRSQSFKGQEVLSKYYE